jgi:hypothetical protein
MFRFTIRELVLLTLVVAMGVGWWADRAILAARAAQLETSNRDLTTRLDTLNPNWRTIRGAYGPQLPPAQETWPMELPVRQQD